MAIEVRDHLSNAPEHIAELAKALGKGDRMAVFTAIYHHKKQIKTVGEIAEITGLTRMRVLQCGGELASKGFVEQVRHKGDTAYKTIRFFQINKRKILSLNKNHRALKKIPTKRNFIVRGLPKTLILPTKGADVKRVTIDDIETFKKVVSISSGPSLPKTVSEEDFKLGVQAILGEAGKFKDWGGEDSDLYSSRLRIGGKRVTAAVAFKGPGMPNKLVPGKMGKNGDQAQRLFRQDADVFLVQHWREIDPSVLELMRSLAVAKSISTGRKIFYGVIDGQDSERLRQAYPSQFNL
jgi:DNA-binding MarR family transcriptional regulator